MAENGFWVRPEDIPLDLNLLRYADGDPVGEQLRVYTLTGLNTNFARPCFALAGRGDADLDDVAGVLEETLHRILDSGGTPEDVYRIMGLVKEEELDEYAREYGEYVNVDLGYCTCGLLDGYETVPDEVARVTNVVTDRQLMQFERAVERGVPLKDAMCLAETEYDGFQADMVIETLAVRGGVADGYLTAEDARCIADPSRSADEMHALLEVARDYGEVAPYLGFSGDDPRETAERVLTAYRLARLVGNRTDECVQLPEETLSALSLPQLYAAYGALYDGVVPADLALDLISPAVSPETMETVYLAFATPDFHMSITRAGQILANGYAPEQQAVLLTSGIALTDAQFSQLFTPDVPADAMRVLARGLETLSFGEVKLVSSPELSAAQLDIVLGAAGDGRVPADAVGLLVAHPDLTTLQMQKVVTSAERGADMAEIKAMVEGMADGKETGAAATLAGETRDMRGARGALDVNRETADRATVIGEEK